MTNPNLDVKALAERLRKHARGNLMFDRQLATALFKEAADMLDRLAAQREDVIDRGAVARIMKELLSVIHDDNQCTKWEEATETAIDAIIRSLPTSREAIIEEWQSIETAPKGKKLICGAFNPLGKWRSFMATYYLPGTLDASEYCDDADDDGFAPEGWYEDSQTHDDILPIKPTHWKPLPAQPRSNSVEDGADE